MTEYTALSYTCGCRIQIPIALIMDGEVDIHLCRVHTGNHQKVLAELLHEVSDEHITANEVIHVEGIMK